MKKNGRYLMTIAALLASTQAAHAASTSTIYTSGWLVLAFFGLCALVVTVQLIPALVMLSGMVKGFLNSKSKITVRQLN